MKRMNKVFAVVHYHTGSHLLPKPNWPLLHDKTSLAGYSEKLPTALSELDKAFTAPEGSKLQSEIFQLHVQWYRYCLPLRSTIIYIAVVIQSSSLNNSLFSISKRINEDNTITYVGRIINEKYADGYELKKEVMATMHLTK